MKLILIIVTLKDRFVVLLILFMSLHLKTFSYEQIRFLHNCATTSTFLRRVVFAEYSVWQNVVDIIPRVTVQTLVQPQLVHVMAYEARGPPKDEDGVQDAHLEVPVRFLPTKLTGLPQQVHKGDGDGSVDVQDEIASLLCRDLLHFQGIFEQRTGGEVGFNKVLDDGDSGIRILHRFNSVPNTHDVLVLFAHFRHEICRSHLSVKGIRKLFGGGVQCASEAWTLRKNKQRSTTV